MTTFDIDALVAGAGVIGLAVARALALRGRSVVIVEAEGQIGTQTSSRNSEILHAGMYYSPGSLKAKACVAGRNALHDFLTSRGIFYRQCGKLIVATSEPEIEKLIALKQRGEVNGVTDLRLLSASEARTIEPALSCVAALHSPSTGIFDSHGYMLSLLADAERHGSTLVLHSKVVESRIGQSAIHVRLDGEESVFRCATLFNCTGLNAPEILKTMAGFPKEHLMAHHYAKGNYFVLAGKSPFSRLVYPVPQEGGLGTHLTIDAQGQARFGPDIEWVTSPDDLNVDPNRAGDFYASIRRFWPDLPDGSLRPGYAGIRAKLAPSGAPQRDFVIQGPETHGVPGLVNMLGIESPGLTASLVLAELACAAAKV